MNHNDNDSQFSVMGPNQTIILNDSISRSVLGKNKPAFLTRPLQSLLKNSLRSHGSFFIILVVLLLFGVLKFCTTVENYEILEKEILNSCELLGSLSCLFYFFLPFLFWFQTIYWMLLKNGKCCFTCCCSLQGASCPPFKLTGLWWASQEGMRAGFRAGRGVISVGPAWVRQRLTVT